MSLVATAMVVLGIAIALIATGGQPERSQAASGPPEMHIAVSGNGCSGTAGATPPNLQCTFFNGSSFALAIEGSSLGSVGGFQSEVYLDGLPYTAKSCSTEVTMTPEAFCLGPTLGAGGQVRHGNLTAGGLPLPPWSNEPSLVSLPNLSCPSSGVSAFELLLTAVPSSPIASEFIDASGNPILLKTRTTADVDEDGPGGDPPVSVAVADNVTINCVPEPTPTPTPTPTAPPQPEMHIVASGAGCLGTLGATPPELSCYYTNGQMLKIAIHGSASVAIGGFQSELFLDGLPYTPKGCRTEVTMDPPDGWCVGPVVGAGGQVAHASLTGIHLSLPLPPWNNAPNLLSLPNISCPAMGGSTFDLVLTAAPYSAYGAGFFDTSGGAIPVATRTTAAVDVDGPGGTPPANMPVADKVTITCGPTPEDDSDGDGMLNSVDTDDDNDGCLDTRELQTMMGSQTSGGLRNPHLLWDFFDVWTHPSMMSMAWERTKVVDLNDIYAIARRFATMGNPLDDPLVPPVSDMGYHVASDRTANGPNGWNLGPPDGVIGLSEVFQVGMQFAHNCT